MKIKRVLVAGAGGALGFEIVRTLRAKGVAVTATYRTLRPGVRESLSALGAEVDILDVADEDNTPSMLERADGAIFTPILSTSGAAARHLLSGQRAVFFSSNNVAIDPEAEVYSQLLEAEKQVLNDADNAVILRPTMIYGYPGDGNMSRLIKTFQRFPVVPLPGRGAALQQPVYYKALAGAAVDALLTSTGQPRICAVAGPEPVAQGALFRAAAYAAGSKSLILPMPLAPVAPVLSFLEKLGLRLPVTSAQIARAGLDKTPSCEHVLLTKTSLKEGLAALAADLDAAPEGA